MHLSFWLFSRQVVSDSLGPLGLQHARLPLSFTISWSLLKVMSIELEMPSNHLILCCRLLLPPSIFPRVRVFSNESVQSIRVSASASVLPVNIQDSFPLGWTDFLTLKSLLQHQSLKASILWRSAFSVVQLSHPSMTTGKTRALSRRKLSAKWCLCFLISCLGLSYVSFQGARVCLSEGCLHSLQWFWRPRKYISI